jgi:sugar lactone lactonase YvrE
MSELQTLMTGIAFGESPRWHDRRLWFSDWGAQEIIALDLEGNSEVILRVPFPSITMCNDFLPDGRLLVISTHERLLLRREPDGSLATHADLSGLSAVGFYEIVVDRRGNAYINGGGFNLMAGERFAPGIVALVTPDGSSRQVADGIAFANGMLVTPDNSTLIVAESYGKKLTAFDIAADGSLLNQRVWADLAGGVPDAGELHLKFLRTLQTYRKGRIRPLPTATRTVVPVFDHISPVTAIEIGMTTGISAGVEASIR